MHEYIIKSMVEALNPTITSSTRARKILEEFWKDKIAIVWDANDVHTAANERGLALTEAEAIKVLQELHHEHNKQFGLEWKDVTDYIDDNVLGRKLTKRELDRFVHKNLLTIKR